MLNLIVIFLQISVLSGSSPVEVAWGFPILEVGMISEDSERFFGPAYVGSPMCQGFHNSQQFTFIDIVVPFCGCEGGRVVGNGVCGWLCTFS